MSKFCGYCGTVLNDSETFCSNCGASFNGQVQQINKKKHTRIILLCSLVVALICIGIAVYFIFFKPTIIGKWESIDYTQTNHTYNSNVYLSVEFTSDNRFIMKDNTNKMDIIKLTEILFIWEQKDQHLILNLTTQVWV